VGAALAAYGAAAAPAAGAAASFERGSEEL
jgi:hypothetical protein